MELILSGNPNLNTVRNVLYFVNKEYENKVEKVLFIDSEGTLKNKKGDSIEGERNNIVRKYLKAKVHIESIYIESEDLHNMIPEIINRELKIYSEEDIIIDMTNGRKLVSSILYTAANLSKIQNLFFLFIDDWDKQKELPEKLTKDDYSIKIISPIKNIKKIGKNAYFEILYYKEKETEVIETFKNYNINNDYLNNMVEHNLKAIISSYFLDKHPETIATIGQLSEALAKELSKKIKNKAKGKIEKKTPNNFSNCIGWLRINFCDKLRKKKNKGLEDYEENLKLLQNIDKILDLIRVYRNISSHPYDLLRGEEEAKIILNAFFYLMVLIEKSGVFK